MFMPHIYWLLVSDIEVGPSADGWLAGADGRFLRLMPRRPARARAVETKENREFPFAESNAVYRRSAEPDHFDCFTRR